MLCGLQWSNWVCNCFWRIILQPCLRHCFEGHQVNDTPVEIKTATWRPTPTTTGIISNTINVQVDISTFTWNLKWIMNCSYAKWDKISFNVHWSLVAFTSNIQSHGVTQNFSMLRMVYLISIFIWLDLTANIQAYINFKLNLFSIKFYDRNENETEAIGVWDDQQNLHHSAVNIKTLWLLKACLVLEAKFTKFTRQGIPDSSTLSEVSFNTHEEKTKLSYLISRF